jgi:predicted transposase/invertase (TIGR01784 family)
VRLLNAVLQLKQRIVSVEVVNPEISPDAPADRGMVLDVLCKHADGSVTNLEMQAYPLDAPGKRILYTWARVYREGIGRGDDFGELTACRVVFITTQAMLPGRRVHSTFRVQEVHDRTILSEDLELHVLELRKLGEEPEDAGDPAEVWARFLAAETDEERRRLAMQNADIHEANQALEQLSQDPEAQRLARWRKDQLRLYRMELGIAERKAREDGLKQGREDGLKQGREDGLKQGREDGLKQGREDGLRLAVRRLCEALGIGLTPEQDGWIATSSAAELDKVTEQLVSLRRWPD